MRYKNSALRVTVEKENGDKFKHIIVASPKIIENLKQRMCEFNGCCYRGTSIRKTADGYEMNLKAYELLHLIIFDEMREDFD